MTCALGNNEASARPHGQPNDTASSAVSASHDARQAQIAEFLEAAALMPNSASPLAGDASARRYLRVATTSGRAVLMDAPRPANESMAFFVSVTTWLRARGLSAPAVLAADLETGLLLLEDLGDALFARVLATLSAPGAQETALYTAATDLLAALPENEAPPGIAPYDEATLLREARLATDWWWPAAAGAAVSSEAIATYEAVLRTSLAPALETELAPVCVLRDYHAENLLWLPDREGAARIGLLDYQDALLGHPAYDLVSLLEDARRDTSAALREAMVARYLARRGLGGEAAAHFRVAYAALGAQRNLKIIGIFARLALRDGKPRYLDLIPRVWAHLQRDLAHPALAPLAALVARHIPPPGPAQLAAVAAKTGEGAP
ncbi:MAG: phosphotransferase [Pseudomonadota bacterium]